MKMVKIDGQDYDFDQMSPGAKGQFVSVQAADAKLNELRRDTAITVTARNIYMQALKKELGNVAPVADATTSGAKKEKAKKA
jgi:hypothetical protein